MIEYTDLLLICNTLFCKLNERTLLFNVIEGNVCYSHPFQQGSQLDEDSHPKRFNLWSLATRRNHIMEIGFNAGHSSLIMLLANRDALLTIFDLEMHPYTRPCFELLQNFFPHMRAYYGDSTKTVASFVKDNPNAKFDLIHIDGNHTIEVLEKDYEHAKLLSRPRSLGTRNLDTIVIVDDTLGPIGDFVKNKAEIGEITFIDRSAAGLMDTPHHEIFRFNKEV